MAASTALKDPLPAYLFTSYQGTSYALISNYTLCLVHCCLRAFALAVPSAWTAFLPDLFMEKSTKWHFHFLQKMGLFWAIILQIAHQKRAAASQHTSISALLWFLSETIYLPASFLIEL